jgi:flagellar biosynthesis protein FlhB
MTKQDLISESKDSEGNPMIKGRIKTLARSLARQRMLQDVPTADVVVVNPTHVAVALKYDVDVAPAPIVMAMGERKLAERIKALAFKANVPVIENRAVGIKSRELYEAPAAMTLIAAHRALEDLVLTKAELETKRWIEDRWARTVYDGLWFSPVREALDDLMKGA